MEQRLDETNGPAVTSTAQIAIELPGALTVATVMQYYPRLQEALGAGEPIVLVGGGDEQADAAGLQLMVAFSQEARRREVAWSWTTPGEALTTTAALLGLDGLLGFAA
jgi:anti-anti-sigma regulatory factor